MAKSLDVRFRGQDDDLPYRTLDVRLTSSQSLLTPARAIDARLVRRVRGSKVDDPRLFEVYSKYGASTVNARMREPEKQQDHTYDVNGLRAVAGGAPLIAFEEFFEEAYPTNQQLEYIIRTSHAISDIVSVPLVSRVTDKLPPEGGYEKYEAFVKRALATIDTYNKKPVMGAIPLRIPFISIDPLVKLYHKNDVTAYCLDFAGSTPSTVHFNLEQVLFALARLGVLQESYLHAINVNPGRPKANTVVSPCRSIVSFGYDVDSYGDLHRVRVKVVEGRPFKPTPVRLFARRDYGDHVVQDGSDLKAVRPEKSGLDFKAASQDKVLARLFNSEQHSIEAKSLPSLFKQVGAKTLESYLAAKKHIEKGTLKLMKELGSALRSGKSRKPRQTKLT